jgi:hypothetical protein
MAKRKIKTTELEAIAKALRDAHMAYDELETQARQEQQSRSDCSAWLQRQRYCLSLMRSQNMLDQTRSIHRPLRVSLVLRRPSASDPKQPFAVSYFVAENRYASSTR